MTEFDPRQLRLGRSNRCVVFDKNEVRSKGVL
jgi:hypothetical protein